MYALALLAPVAVWPGTCAPTTIKTPLIGILAGAMAAAVCAKAALDGAWRLPRSPLLYPVAAMIVWKAAAVLYGGYWHTGPGLLQLAAVYGAVFVGTIAFVRTPRQVTRLLLICALGAVPVGVIGVLDHYGLRLPGLEDNGLGRIYSTTGNPTFLAAYLVMMFPVQLSLFLLARTPAKRVLMGLCVSLTFLCVIWTYSRGSWAGLALGLVLLAALMAISPARGAVKARIRGLGVLALALIAVAAFSGAWRSPGARGTEIERSTKIVGRESDRIRTALMTAGLRMFRDHWAIGAGLGGYPVRMLDYIPGKPVPGSYDFGEDYPHNELIRAAAEEGLPGVAISLWLAAAIGACVVLGIKRGRTEDGATRALLTAGVASGLVAFSGDLMTNVGILQLHIGVFCWLLMGALSALSQPDTAEVTAAKPRVRPASARAVLLTAGAAAFIVVAYSGVPQFAADIHTRKAAWAMRTGDVESGISEFQAALRLNSAATIPLYNLGRTYLQAGYPEDAIAALKIYDRHYPHGNQVDHYLGKAYLEMGDYRAAVRYGEEAVRRDQWNAAAWQALAAAYRMHGQKDRASGTILRAVSLRTDRDIAERYDMPLLRRSSGLGHYLIAQELLRPDTYDEALAELQAAVDREPRSSLFLTSLGSVYYGLRRLPEAERTLKAALSADPDSIDAHGYLAGVYLLSGRKKEARSELELALSLGPDRPRRAAFEQMLRRME